MSEPTLSVFVPTFDPERPLSRLLLSILKQPIGPDDEVLVCIDTHDGPKPEIAERVKAFGPQFKVFEFDAGHHCWGHCQINHLFTKATKEWVVGNDDDDIFAPGAFDAIRQEIKALPIKMPLMFRFRPYNYDRPLWEERVLEICKVGGHCLVAPNDGKLGKFSCHYAGDYHWIEMTLQNWEMMFKWADPIIAIARPTKPEDDPEKW